jgi:hypothetical protein
MTEMGADVTGSMIGGLFDFGLLGGRFRFFSFPVWGVAVLVICGTGADIAAAELSPP